MQENTSHIEQTKSAAERRRYPRIPLAMRATIHGDVLEGKPCIVRDFCLGGLFLSWSDMKTGEEIKSLRESITGEKFSVEFNVKLKNTESKNYSIDFNIVRIFEGGMGVSFNDPDKRALNILEKIAKAKQKRIEEAKKINTDDTTKREQTDTSFNSSMFGQLNIESNLNSILQAYFKKLDNKLIMSFKDTLDEQERFDYFNSREIFKDNLNVPKEEILEAVSAQLESLETKKWEKTFSEDVDGSSLALVDEKEFEAYLVLTGLISDAEANNRLLLFKVSKRVSDIFKTEFDEALNPIGFSRLCRTIDHFLQHHQYGYESLKLAYMLMHEALIPDLVIMYEKLSEGVEAEPERKVTEPFRNTSAQSSPDVYENNSVVQEAEQSDSLNFNTFASFPSNQQAGFVTGSNQGFPAIDAVSSGFQIAQNANGIAQGLMSLQQNIAGSSAVDSVRKNLAESQAQTQNLIALIDKIQQEDIQNWQNGDTINDISGRLAPLLSSSQQQVGDSTQHNLSLAGGVLDFLKGESFLSSPAKQDFNRLQTVLYKQALSEGGLFQEDENPLRNIINVLEKLDQKGSNNQSGPRNALDEIIEKLLELESYDSQSLNEITDQLNQLLELQNGHFDQQVQKIVEQCDLEQTLLKDLKKDDNQNASEALSQQDSVSGEYKVWKDHAIAMQRGDSIVMDDGNGEKKHLSLAWNASDASRFVFVDGEGNKSANMTQQELIVRLLKGSAELVDAEQKPLFDRAVISSLFDAYDDVKKQIVTDPSTGLLSLEKYRSELELILENSRDEHVEHMFFYLDFSSVETDQHDSAELDAYIRHCADQAKEIFGDQCIIGRLSDECLGLTSQFISREEAIILAETLLKSLEDSIQQAEHDFTFPVSIGIATIHGRIKGIDEVFEQGSLASQKAKSLGPNQAWLHEELFEFDSTLPEVENKTIDWQLLLEDYSHPDEVIPLFGEQVVPSGNAKSKPLLYLFTAIEDEDDKLRTPSRFVRACFDKELVSEYEKQFIGQSLAWMADNKKRISKVARTIISISGATINSTNILDFVIEKLTEVAVPPGKICFEIPGNPSEDEIANVHRFIRTLNEFGCRFSLGQHSSDSLSHEAMKLPADFICIDESLTNSVVNNSQTLGLIKSINDIAHMMDKQTIIPHRIDEQTIDALSGLNIDFVSSSDSEHSERLNQVAEEGV